MFEIYNGNFVDNDRDRLILKPRIAREAKLIDAFLDEVACDQKALATLLKRSDEYPHPLFNVKAVDCFLNQGFNISRIRPLSGGLGKFRILFALDPQYDAFYLLAIVEKPPIHPPWPIGEPPSDFYNYERNHNITQRICDEYCDLGLPRLHA